MFRFWKVEEAQAQAHRHLDFLGLAVDDAEGFRLPLLPDASRAAATVDWLEASSEQCSVEACQLSGLGADDLILVCFPLLGRLRRLHETHLFDHRGVLYDERPQHVVALYLEKWNSDNFALQNFENLGLPDDPVIEGSGSDDLAELINNESPLALVLVANGFFDEQEGSRLKGKGDLEQGLFAVLFTLIAKQPAAYAGISKLTPSDEIWKRLCFVEPGQIVGKVCFGLQVVLVVFEVQIRALETAYQPCLPQRS